MVKRLMCIVALSALSIFVPRLAEAAKLASCHFGQEPDYRYIWRVTYGVEGCYGRCPHHWASWELGRNGIYTEYQGDVGTFRISATFDSVLAVLKRYHFFSIRPIPVDVTDVNYAVVVVHWCGVIQTIFSPSPAHQAGFGGLDSGLDDLIRTSRKVKRTNTLELKDVDLGLQQYFL